MYSKIQQIGKKKQTRASINKSVNKKLRQLQIDKDIRHCELCSTQAISNAHRYPRRWYYGNEELLSDYTQVLFICLQDHARLDDRSQTTEEEKEKIFVRLRGK